MGLSERLEFGDFYRFCASLGLLLMLAALVLPWLFVSDFASLSVPVSRGDLEEMCASEGPRTCRAAISSYGLYVERISYIALVHRLIPWLMGAALLSGILCLWYGVSNWHHQQGRRDKREQIELDALVKQHAPPKTDTQIEAQAAIDAVIEMEIDESPAERAPAVERVGAPVPWSNTSRDSERTVLDAMERRLTGSYMVLRDRMLGHFPVDAILMSRLRKRNDAVLEIKVLHKGFKLGYLFEVIQKTSLLAEKYAHLMRRGARGVVVLVIDDGALDRIGKTEVLGRAEDLARSLTPDVIIRIVSASRLHDEAIFNPRFLDPKLQLLVFRGEE